MVMTCAHKSETEKCFSVPGLKFYRKLLWMFLVLLFHMEMTYFRVKRISLQILLTIAVSTESCERSFSKLKLILSYLRASIGKDSPSDLALLSIERETLENINFDNVIDEFATIKLNQGESIFCRLCLIV